MRRSTGVGRGRDAPQHSILLYRSQPVVGGATKSCKFADVIRVSLIRHSGGSDTRLKLGGGVGAAVVMSLSVFPVEWGSENMQLFTTAYLHGAS